MSPTRTIGVVLVVAWLAAFGGGLQAHRQTGAPPKPGTAPAAPLLGDQTDGSRARPVHRIPLRDSEGDVIRPGDRPLLPFSPSHTCGNTCHDVATIGRGWHFMTAVPGSPGGRRGEPWILIDPETATQLPLSNHAWPGTFTPEQAGLSPWQFAKQFGGRTPGGLNGDNERGADLRVRWAVAGALTPNCLACHDAAPEYDQAEYGRQIGLENFRWAAAAASGLAVVTGSAREMPNTFDYLLPMVEDSLRPRVPAIAYADGRFLPDAKVVFDIVREVPARRCYFCHSTVDVAHTGQGRWNADADVHLAAGLTCVDCHRNGLDHRITRGYEGDPAAAALGATTLSCRGCHLATEDDRVFADGRMGAPSPKHEGLPPIHLQKLSCTACHSGPRPEDTSRRLKTSLAHRLGGLNVNKSDDALPHLSYPVFAREDDGVTTPNRAMWPAFWGAMAGGKVNPIPVDRVKAAMTKGKMALKRSAEGGWPDLDEATAGRVLAMIQAGLETNQTAVYVAGGRLHRVDGAGRLSAEDHPSARPYLWPIAHDVRPAGTALGARGCQECHDESAPIFFGQVSVDSPLASDRSATWTMARFQPGLDAAGAAEFARTFRYRPWMKGAVVATTALLLLFVAGYAATGMRRLSAAAVPARWARVAANAIAAALCVVSVASGLPALLSGESLTGSRLILHVATGPAFLAGALLALVFWAHRNAFGRADWNRLRRPVGAASAHGATTYVALVMKIAFWIAAIAVIPMVISVALVLFPAIASAWQPAMLDVHRTSSGVFVVAAAVFAAAALAAWMGRLRPTPRGPAETAADGAKPEA